MQNITSLYDALWWSIETVSTVAYGEYYPVTALGRFVATVMMFAAIFFVWIVVGIIGSNLVARKIKEKETKSSTSTTRLLEDIKNTIKIRIDCIEDLESAEVEDLIRMIKSLNSKESDQVR